MEKVTLNESLKQLSNEIVTADYAEKKNNEIRKAIAKVYESYRKDLLKKYFATATPEQLQKELYAFKADTKDGLCKVVIAAATKTTKDGKLLDDENNVIEKAETFATVRSTNKDGETVATRLVFRYPYTADTLQRNISIVASWLAFRETVSDSFAFMKQLEREKVAKEIAALEKKVFAAFMNDDLETAANLKAQIKQLKQENGI